MNQEKLLIIESARGSCLTTLSSFLLMLLSFFIWVLISNFAIEKTSVDRQEMFTPEWLLPFSMLLGFALHEYCQYAFIRLFGGYPQYGNRKSDKRTYLEQKYQFRVTMRFWSPDKKFSLAQYLTIVFSPTVITFLLLPATMMMWKNPVFTSMIWMIGFVNSFFIALDFLIAFKLIISGKFNYYVVDTREGTYLVKK